MHRLAFALLATSALAAGCAEYRDPSVPPFRVAPFGAGLELATGGRRVSWTTDDGRALATLKVARNAVRVFDAEHVRVARLVVGTDGYRLVDRDGTELCRVVLDDAGSAAIGCADGTQLAIERLAEGLVVRTGAGETIATLRQDATELVVEQSGARLVVVDEGSGSWSVVREGSGEPTPLGNVESTRAGDVWAAAMAIELPSAATHLGLRGAIGWVFETLSALRPAD